MGERTGSSRLSAWERRVLRALGQTLIPSDGGIPLEAGETDVAETLERWLAGFEPSSRSAVRAMLVGFDLTPLLSRNLRTFTRLSPDAREEWIATSARSRNAPRREALTGLTMLAQLAYASRPSVGRSIGYDGSPLVAMDGPARRVDLTVRTWPDVPGTMDVDVVVVGSGAGGAVAADTLSRAGLSVVVVEEGGQYRSEAEADDHPVERMMRHFRDNGLTFAIGSPMISMPMGRVVGGTTVINSGTCFRTPDDVLADWAGRGIDRVSPDEMAPFLDRVEEILGVTPVPDDLLGANGEITRRGAETLGWSGGPIRRNIRGCHGHGACAFGCPIDAKQAMHVTYLPRAVDAGAVIVAHAKVRELVVDKGRVNGVVAEISDPVDRVRRSELRVRARATVVAAGAVNTPALLMRQKLAGRSGQLGRNLVIHPGAGTSGLFGDELSAWRGTMQSYYVDEHLDDGVLLEATFPPPGLGYSAGALPGRGHYDELFSMYPRVASIGSICSDEGNGRIRTLGDSALVRYSLSRRDLDRVVEGIACSAELLFAAGAETVYPMLPGLEAIDSPGDVAKIRGGRWKRSDLSISAYHPMGTARMGGDPASSVVDPWGAVWDVPGLWVMDASILPSSTHVNPQITIMAMVTRCAERLADRLS